MDSDLHVGLTQPRHSGNLTVGQPAADGQRQDVSFIPFEFLQSRKHAATFVPHEVVFLLIAAAVVTLIQGSRPAVLSSKTVDHRVARDGVEQRGTAFFSVPFETARETFLHDIGSQIIIARNFE